MKIVMTAMYNRRMNIQLHPQKYPKTYINHSLPRRKIAVCFTSLYMETINLLFENDMTEHTLIEVTCDEI